MARTDPTPADEPQVEIAPGATVLAAPTTATPAPAPALYGFEEEPTRESNFILDEPDVPAPTIVTDTPAAGVFVGLGVTQISRADGEWAVDPDTGLITGPVIPAA